MDVWMYGRYWEQSHEFADMTEDTICGFGEKIKSKSKTEDV